MEIKKYTNGAWTDLDKPVKEFNTYTDEATTLPMTIQTSATDAVENYQVYGKTVENLADAIIEHANINSDGRIANPGAIDPASDTFVLYIAPVVSGKTYTITTSTYDSAVVYAFYSAQPAYGVVSYNNTRTVLEGTHQATITAPITGWIAFRDYVTAPAGMIVEGPTPAPVYVPPGASGGVGEATSGSEPAGYKIPILCQSGVTENLFDGIIYQNNTIITTQSGTTQSSSNYALGNFINVGDATVITMAFQYGHDTTTTRSFFPGLFYDAQQNLIGTNIVAQKPSEGAVEIHITVPANATYFQPQWKKTTDTNIMIILGSTPPDHYIPHRYTSNYDLFVGDSKLYEDEYLDYEEQKVYKRTENLFNANLAIPNSYYNNVGVLTPAEENLAASPLIPVESGETYIRSSQGTAVGNVYVVFDNDKNFLYRGSPSTAGLPITIEGNGAYIGFTIDPDTTPLQSYMFTKGSTVPASYAPYLQPTDPPTPFPIVHTYIGENNLSVDTTVQPEKVVLEYAGWKGIGNVKKYESGEWSDNNDI